MIDWRRRAHLYGWVRVKAALFLISKEWAPLRYGLSLPTRHLCDCRVPLFFVSLLSLKCSCFRFTLRWQSTWPTAGQNCRENAFSIYLFAHCRLCWQWWWIMRTISAQHIIHHTGRTSRKSIFDSYPSLLSSGEVFCFEILCRKRRTDGVTYEDGDMIESAFSCGDFERLSSRWTIGLLPIMTRLFPLSTPLACKKICAYSRRPPAKWHRTACI